LPPPSHFHLISCQPHLIPAWFHIIPISYCARPHLIPTWFHIIPISYVASPISFLPCLYVNKHQLIGGYHWSRPWADRLPNWGTFKNVVFGGCDVNEKCRSHELDPKSVKLHQHFISLLRKPWILSQSWWWV
jgi:hypothetical protein